MKRVLMLLLALIALSGLAAAEIQYWNNIQYFTYLPRQFTSGTPPVQYTYTVIGTRFTPVAGCTVNGFYSLFYNAGQAGNLAVKGEIYAVNESTGLPEGLFPLASLTIQYADLLFYDNGQFTFFDFTDPSLWTGGVIPTFPIGQEFFFALSAPTAILGSTYTTPMLDASVVGHSYRYFTQGFSGWRSYAGEFTFVADVTYTGAMRDVAAKSLWFTGDFFVQPGETITYEADIANYGEVAESDVPVYIEVYDLAAPTTPIWSDVEYVTMAVGDTLHHINTFSPYTYPSTAGEYKVVLRTGLAGDMVLTNNEVSLEQQVVILPDLLDYDDGVGETAHAFYLAGDGWANSFNYATTPVQLTEISFNIRDNTWPTGAVGNEFLRAIVYADNGAGAPGVILHDTGIVPCTLGAWNTYDVSTADLVFAAGETFYVAYIQVGDYPNCPGLLGDGTPPFSGWATSWYMNGGVWDSPNATDEDMMIRAYVVASAAPPSAPQISVSIVDGDTVLDWADVAGANSYNIYASDDPIVNWEYVETVTESTVTYPGTDVRAFFSATACSNANGTKAAGKKISTNPNLEYKRNRPVIDNQMFISLPD